MASVAEGTRQGLAPTAFDAYPYVGDQDVAREVIDDPDVSLGDVLWTGVISGRGFQLRW